MNAVPILAVLAVAGVLASSTAHASPDAFPDVTGMPSADGDAYFKDEGATFKYGWEFLAPNGLVCWQSEDPRREYARTGCVGADDVRGAQRWTVSAERGAPATLESPADQSDSQTESPPLESEPGHVLRTTATDQFCVVEADTVACKVGEHGFVLTPASTELF